MIDRLLTKLHRVFNREPQGVSVLEFRINYTTSPQHAPMVISPVNHSYLAGAQQVFTLDNAGADLCELWVGNASGGNDIGVFPAGGTANATITVPGLPLDGRKIYVRLRKNVGGTWSTAYDYVYTASWGAGQDMPPLNRLTVRDLVLSVVAPSGSSYAVDLSEITVAEVITAIYPHHLFGAYFDVLLVNEAYGNLPARGLIEVDNQDFAIDTFLRYPTALLYKEMQTYGWVLQEQADRIKAAEKELYMPLADEDWLDFWGSRFGILRYSGESDAAYGRRIMHELLRATQNNVALALIVKEALGVDVRILDAAAHVEEIPPGHEGDAAGRFLLDLGLDNTLTEAEVIDLTAKAQDIIRKYKAAGTDFFMMALRKMVPVAESCGLSDAVASLITIGVEDALDQGYIKVGAGWRVGCPGLKVGLNDAIKEQVFVQVFDESEAQVSAGIYSG